MKNSASVLQISTRVAGDAGKHGFELAVAGSTQDLTRISRAAGGSFDVSGEAFGQIGSGLISEK